MSRKIFVRGFWRKRFPWISKQDAHGAPETGAPLFGIPFWGIP
jgi:hypothetical protein